MERKSDPNELFRKELDIKMVAATIFVGKSEPVNLFCTVLTTNRLAAGADTVCDFTDDWKLSAKLLIFPQVCVRSVDFHVCYGGQRTEEGTS